MQYLFLHDITTINDIYKFIMLHFSKFFASYLIIFVYALGTNTNMDQILHTSQSNNILSTYTNPPNIKRGPGRPRKADVANVISPEVPPGLCTRVPITKASIPVLTNVTNTVGSRLGVGRPRKNPVVAQVSPNVCEGSSTVPIQTGSDMQSFFLCT